jgi:hypothetical protein
LQSLEDGAVLAVGGRHGDPVLLQERQNHRAARDEGLLVGQRDALLGLDSKIK